MNHPTAKCRCGVEQIIAPDTKVMCTRCGMAFQAFTTAGKAGKERRYDMKAEDLRDVAVERSPREVVAEDKARAAELEEEDANEEGA